MKHKLIIFLFLCFIFLSCFLAFWTIKQALTANQASASELKNEKIIALNFDDGPNPKVLQELLPLLEKYGVKANFFVIGSAVAANKNLVKKMHDAGHRIENHSWRHENFKKLFREKGADTIRNNVLKTETAILNATGQKPKFFRPPQIINVQIFLRSHENIEHFKDV